MFHAALRAVLLLAPSEWDQLRDAGQIVGDEVEQKAHRRRQRSASRPARQFRRCASTARRPGRDAGGRIGPVILGLLRMGQATLKDRAGPIIAEAASNSSKVQCTRIKMNSYSDSSGTRQYNQGLSVCRTQSRGGLVKGGAPQAAICIEGFGETHLLVPTGPGVSEPENRRVDSATSCVRPRQPARRRHT
jgi:outer membrane protein OmpA-like peptidoglycan-associated protein